jgi:glutathione synthase
MDPLPSVDPTHDTTYVIMEETESRGHEVWVCQSRDLVVGNDSARVRAKRVTLEVNGDDHYEYLEESRRDLAEFDLVWMREDPPFDLNYLHATYLLDQVPVPVLNDPAGLRNANEKMFALNFPDHLPATWVGSRIDNAEQFLESVGGDGVVKTLEGFGGEQVFRVKLEAPNSRGLLRMLTEGEDTPVMIQEFLPEVLEQGDRRIIVLGGKPIGGLTRYPTGGDFRSNIHSGGRAGESDVRPVEESICGDLKPELLDRGLHLVGLDLIGDRITEINVTSPTCVQEINREAGEALEEEIVDYAIERFL